MNQFLNHKLRTLFFMILIGLTLNSCEKNKIESKGFQVNEISENEEGEKVVGLPIDSLNITIQPHHVLLTGDSIHRITPLMKVNYNKKTGKPFIGAVSHHSTWNDYTKGNNWNYHIIPGFSAFFGYNVVNVSHYNKLTHEQAQFFYKPVLIRTVYYPSFERDTLNYQPVNRNYYMVSVYDEDTNKDGFLNLSDLRKLYLFNIDGKYHKELVPNNYSVFASDFDPANDMLNVYARFDQNMDGQTDETEPVHIFWIDLKDPEHSGILYQ